MGYSREQVVELFEEFADGSSSKRTAVNGFLKEKGLLPSLEVGKWYKYTDSNIHLVCITTIKTHNFCGYGFNTMGWTDGTSWTKDDLIEATNEEVENALIAEAEEQGHVYNRYEFKNGRLLAWMNGDNECLDMVCLFYDGKWATIIEDTKLDELKKKYKELGEEIEKLEK